MTAAVELWESKNQTSWKTALDRYWDFVKEDNLSLEREMDQLDAETVAQMDGGEWYEFLLFKYFKWKYTAPNRYASTTKFLKAHRDKVGLQSLCDMKAGIFAGQASGIREGLEAARKIPGLGPAGASGLLALLFPKEYGTVDQFVVKALSRITTLPQSELDLLSAMSPESLSTANALILIQIMGRKADALNALFDTDFWTPRKIDMILWATRE